MVYSDSTLRGAHAYMDQKPQRVAKLGTKSHLIWKFCPTNIGFDGLRYFRLKFILDILYSRGSCHIYPRALYRYMLNYSTNCKFGTLNAFDNLNIKSLNFHIKLMNFRPFHIKKDYTH